MPPPQLGVGRARDRTRPSPSGRSWAGRPAPSASAPTHARSGDAVSIASYLGDSGSFDRAMADFAEAYADQNEHDHAALQRAITDGDVMALTGV